MNQELIRQNLKKAFRILRRNYGCPGKDGMSIKDVKKSYDEHEAHVLSILSDYQSRNIEYRTSEIIDYRQNKRQIFVYSIYDRWIQQYFRLQLAPVVEKLLVPYSFAYRRAVNEENMYKYILESQPRYLLYVDIKKFYDSIHRDLLKEILAKLRVDFDLVENCLHAVSTLERGLPAGNVLSPILSNIYLHFFDLKFHQHYARFGDDLYFWGLDSTEETRILFSNIQRELSRLSLLLNEKKTVLIENPNNDNIREL